MRFFLPGILVAAALCSCFKGDAARGQKGSRVLVSIVPQAFFAERIAGDRAAVEVLVEPGQSPHSFEPSPRKVAAISECAAWFLSGMPFEASLIEGSGPALSELKKFDSRKGVALIDAEKEGCDCPGEHGQEDHEHGLKDPHFWLDPDRAAVMASNICEGLCEIDPEGKETFEKNLEGLKAELEEARAAISRRLKPFEGSEVFVFHPAFGYFMERFGLVQRAVETGGKEPGPKSLAMLIEHAKERGVKVIFVQPQFPSTSSKAVAEAIGGKVVAMDPLARDYFANLESMASAVEEALR